MEVNTLPLDAIEPQFDGSQPTSVPPELVPSVFQSRYIDLISKPLNSRILAVSDEWFAPASNLTNPNPPIHRPGVFVPSGAWYDGWESKRHNAAPYDHVTFGLGVSSARIRGVLIDTAFFNGNHAPEVAVQAATAASDAEVLEPGFEWTTVLPKVACGPNRVQAWELPARDETTYTHVRLLMFPDGGIARFRLYGTVVASAQSLTDDGPYDLAAAVNGGLAIACSDQHFGTKDNLLLPGRGIDMSDGWETKRTRGVHIDWVVITLGSPGVIDRLVVDTAHFRGNYPQKVQVFAATVTTGQDAPRHDNHDRWVQILRPTPTGPDREHEYGLDMLDAVHGTKYAHVKLVIIPDGGVKRLRVFGRRT